MKKYILGINYGSGHNSSAAIIYENQVIAAIEEERLSRVKSDNSFPNKSIEFCLSKCKITPDEIEFVAIGWDPFAEIFKKFIFLFKTLSLRIFFRKIHFILTSNLRILKYKNKLKKKFKNSKVFLLNHHLCHAASSYYFSNFENSHILTLDGRGDCSTGSISIAKKGKFKIKKESF